MHCRVPVGHLPCDESTPIISAFSGRLCCHSARPGQAGKLGAEEPDEIQQGQV